MGFLVKVPFGIYIFFILIIIISYFNFYHLPLNDKNYIDNTKM